MYILYFRLERIKIMKKQSILVIIILIFISSIFIYNIVKNKKKVVNEPSSSKLSEPAETQSRQITILQESKEFKLERISSFDILKSLEDYDILYTYDNTIYAEINDSTEDETMFILNN